MHGRGALLEMGISRRAPRLNGASQSRRNRPRHRASVAAAHHRQPSVWRIDTSLLNLSVWLEQYAGTCNETARHHSDNALQ